MRIFLSHAHADAEQALGLSAALKKEGYEVWDAANDAMPGSNLHLEVGRALDRSDAMIVLLSPNAAKSPSVQGEIDYALGSPKFRDRLFPVLVKPTTDVPWILERLQWIDATMDPSQTAHRVIDALRKAPVAA